MEKTKRQIEKALEYCEKINNSKNYDPIEIEDSKIPVTKEIGVYLWRSKKDGEIVYVGRAIGKNGLHQRIITQHLRASYTKSVLRARVRAERNEYLLANSLTSKL